MSRVESKLMLNQVLLWAIILNTAESIPIQFVAYVGAIVSIMRAAYYALDGR